MHHFYDYERIAICLTNYTNLPKDQSDSWPGRGAWSQHVELPTGHHVYTLGFSFIFDKSLTCASFYHS